MSSVQFIKNGNINETQTAIDCFSFQLICFTFLSVSAEMLTTVI